MKFLPRINKLDPYCSRYSQWYPCPTDSKDTAISWVQQLASKSVPWCRPRSEVLANTNRRTAEFSEFFQVPRFSRFTFCGIDAKPSRIHIFRYSVAGQQD